MDECDIMNGHFMKGLWDEFMRIGAYQFAVSGNIEDNYQKIQNAIQRAVQRGVQLIVFPECALTGYPLCDMKDSFSVDFDQLNRIYDRLQNIVDAQAIHVIVGSIVKRGHLCCNSALIFSPNQKMQIYHKRALWGWDKDNFCEGFQNGVFDIQGWRIGVRICYEVRFPEFFRELYNENTDLNVILFYDISNQEDMDRYELIRSHIRTRAVENVTYTLSVDTCSFYQTAPTAIYDRSGRAVFELKRNTEDFLVFDLLKNELSFGEKGRKEISDRLMKG